MSRKTSRRAADGDTDHAGEGAAPSKPDHGSASETPTFQNKGIGANLILTVAAATVPLIILSVAGLSTFAGRRKPGNRLLR